MRVTNAEVLQQKYRAGNFNPFTSSRFFYLQSSDRSISTIRRVWLVLLTLVSFTFGYFLVSTDRSKAVVSVLVLLFVALWFILQGDLFYVLPCVILFLCFSVLLALQLPRLGKTELIFVLFVRLFDLCLFGFVGFLFLLVSGKGYGL